MKTIRSNVFETNSSSVHTVCLQSGDDISGVLERDYNGNALIRMHEFGWSGSCNTPEEKLSYLCLIIHYMHKDAPGTFWCGDTKSDYCAAADFVESTPEFQRIKNAICSYCQYPNLKIDREDIQEGYIDHQSIENYTSLDDWLNDHGINTDYDIYKFVIGRSYIEIDNDNG